MKANINGNINTKKITIIIGPTAAGKSEYAIQCAKQSNAHIISADAFQIYKGLNIGTATLSKKDQQNIPHYLINTKAPNDLYNVTQFLNDTHAIIHQLKQDHIPIIICGGTGLYIRSFLYNYQFPPQPAISTQHYPLDTHQLWSKLNAIDPDTAAKIPYQNRRRVSHALDIFYANNDKPSLLKQQSPTIRDDVTIIGLHVPKDQLIKRINTRVDTMIQMGLIEEVQQLLQSGIPPEAQAFQAIGYKEIINYLNNHYCKSTAITKIKVKTRQFAKRQMTWFKKIPHVKWIDINETATNPNYTS